MYWFLLHRVTSKRLNFQSMFEEIPVVIKNSHLVNALLTEVEESMPEQDKYNFLDLATGYVVSNVRLQNSGEGI